MFSYSTTMKQSATVHAASMFGRVICVDRSHQWTQISGSGMEKE
jgi:hypothetical protein